MEDLNGLVAVVTGASSGIGPATVSLLERGASVIALDRQPFPTQKSVASVTADVRDQLEVDEAITTGIARFGRLDIFVNNAGIGSVGTVEDNEDNEDAEWRTVFDVNLLRIVHLMRACLPHLRQSQNAAVVNVSSIAATAGLINRACCSASKGAVLSLTLAMAANLLQEPGGDLRGTGESQPCRVVPTWRGRHHARSGRLLGGVRVVGCAQQWRPRSRVRDSCVSRCARLDPDEHGCVCRGGEAAAGEARRYRQHRAP
jgi:NADP-dependent 3-hydroxy acid dehydrogenase YdfG